MRIGVPPGVGDTYWALTKLAAWRAKHGADVRLAVQKTPLTRATEWPALVPELVDAADEFAFQPDADCRSAQGFSRKIRGVDCVMWPNGALDSGLHLTQWLPEYATDQTFKIRTVPDAGPPRVVVYVSSEGVNRAWMPALGPVYWSALIEEVGKASGQVPTVIGKGWDKAFRDRVAGVEFEDLIGQTDLPTVAGILESARVVVGVICGMTILANHFRTPAVALAPSTLPPRFPDPYAWVPPDSPYAVIRAHEVPAAPTLASIAMTLARPRKAPAAVAEEARA